MLYSIGNENISAHRAVLLRRKGPTHTAEDLYGPFRLQAKLEQEKFRRNHVKKQFSLIVFEIIGREKMETCIGICANDIRNTDRVGMYDNSHMAVILPETTVNGAWIVENRLGKHIQKLAVHKKAKIKTYMYTHISHA